MGPERLPFAPERGENDPDVERLIEAWRYAGPAIPWTAIVGHERARVTSVVIEGGVARLATRADGVALGRLSAEELAGHAAGLLGGIAAEGEYLGLVAFELLDEVLGAQATIDEQIRAHGLGPLREADAAAFRAWSGSAAAVAVDRVRARAVPDAMSAAVIAVVHARPALERVAAALLEEGELDADRLAALLGD